MQSFSNFRGSFPSDASTDGDMSRCCGQWTADISPDMAVVVTATVNPFFVVVLREVSSCYKLFGIIESVELTYWTIYPYGNSK